MLDDPRMRGFRFRSSVEDVLGLIDAQIDRLGPESVDIREASCRVLAAEMVAIDAVPSFDRAAMDGYALKGEETFGASSYAPALFTMIGAARPGRAWQGEVQAGEAVEVTTGSPLPTGADAVVKFESTDRLGAHVSVTEPTPPGRHVGRRGEDILPGTTVLHAGRVLRPQDLGVLSSIGIRSVGVVARPRVIIVVTGDELLEAGTPATGCRIADSNSVMLAALVERDGGVSKIVGPLPDDRPTLRTAIERAATESDLVLISGGSSAGPEDHAPGIIAELGRLAVHGVALRPASPTGLGWLGPTPVVLLPGNPVSCLCAYDFFAGRIVRKLGGRPIDWPYRSEMYLLGRKLVSSIGRVDYARVSVENGQVEPLAISGASILSSATRADGFVVVPQDLEGYGEGEIVKVWLYDQPSGMKS